MDSRFGGVAPVDLAQRHGTPTYVYDEASLREACREIAAFCAPLGIRPRYALKANTNPTLIGIIRESGLAADAVSVGEVRAALSAGFLPHELSYNGNNVTDDEMQGVLDAGVHITVDALSQLQRLGCLAPGGRVGLRVNTFVGAGHHAHVITGGPEAKFGIEPDELAGALAIARDMEMAIDGLHQHIGSGILDPAPWLASVEVLLPLAAQTPDLSFLNFGGGLGIPYSPDDTPLDLDLVAERAAPILDDFRKRHGRPVELRIEPGRFVVARCGTLLVRVVTVKRRRDHTFVGTDSGFNHLLRPALYGSYHEIENVSRPQATPESVTVVGNICETGDTFAVNRVIPRVEEGDLLAIRDVGAYGYSMASTYNSRALPAEVLVANGESRVIR